jgi:putative ABC transport system permease protein
MIRNFILIAFRNLFREQLSTVINIAGLMMGLTCSIFIFLWAMDELRYDRFHKDHERIFAIMENQTYSDGETITYDASPAPLAEKLQHDFPEVEVSSHYSWPRQMLFTDGQQSIYHEGFFADTSFFKLFTFPLIEGNPGKPMPDLKSVVISSRMAEKYFPGQSALGKILRVDNEWDATITAVLENVPENSTIWFDFILPFQLYAQQTSKNLDWSNHVTFTYVKLRTEADAESFSTKIKDLLSGTYVENSQIKLFPFPLKELRLFWEFENGVQTGGGRIVYVIGLSLASFLILVAACVNLMNLATARAAKRAKEVGIRKVAGASRPVLIQQFLIESMLLSFTSLFLALMCVHLLLPLFNFMTEKKLTMDYSDGYLICGLLSITLFTGLLAGSYPAFLLSSFKPITVLRRHLFSHQRGLGLRSILVFFQFGLSIVLIIGAFAFNNQMQYMLTKDLGFDKENLLYFQPRPGSLNNIESFKQELLQNPLFEYVGQGYDHPININNNDIAQWDGIPGEETVTVQTTVCDADYVKALGLRLLKGRHFLPDLASDSTNFIINETCANQMGFENPIGQRLKINKTEGSVIGVVNDFHHRDFESPIAPVIFVLGRSEVKPMTVFVRYKSGETIKATAYLEKVYKKFEPVFPLEISFLDTDLKRFLKNALVIGRLSIYLTAIIIFISCLGLFGLTLSAIEKRTKEIGVRKVLGASVSQVIILLSQDFLKPVIISIITASPIGYLLINQWLDGFAYHATVQWWWFLVVGIIILMMTLITVGFHSAKAALTNPTESLRSE